MEFSVNLTKIGLDPLMAILGGNICGLPFKKVFVKSRSSTSFTSELKDFVSPFYFFNAPKATVQATVPKFCGASGSTDIFVTNPLSTSTYNWVTADGHIVGTSSGTTITADTTGTYIVKQQLLASCPTYATDTIIITADPICTTLGCDILGFDAVLNKGVTQLNWEAVCRQKVNYFEIERSIDGIHFTTVDHVTGTDLLNQSIRFNDIDNVTNLNSEFVYYRVKAVADNKANPKYSKIVKINLSSILAANIRLTPNPVASSLLVNVITANAGEVELRIYSGDGKLVKSYINTVRKGANTFTVTGFQNIPRGLYHAILTVDKQNYTQKIVVNN
jgi:hypothetical protein